MAQGHPEAVAALHLNLILVEAEDAMPTEAEELAWAKRRSGLARRESAYSHLQGTRPQTLGIAMSDSPVGVAAWILEIFGVWAAVPCRADCSHDHCQEFDEATLLSNTMLYAA